MYGRGIPQFYRDFDRVNLHDRPSALPRADGQAALNLFPLLSGRRVLLLGKRVQRAFLLYDPPPMSWRIPTEGNFVAAGLPHPSGRCRWYNSHRNTRNAAEFLRNSTAPLVYVCGLSPGACQDAAERIAGLHGLRAVSLTGNLALDLDPGRVVYGKHGPLYRLAFRVGGGRGASDLELLRAMARCVTFVYVPALMDRGSVFRYEKALDYIRALGGTVYEYRNGGELHGSLRIPAGDKDIYSA